jgi:hypothetical protein
MEMDDCDSDKQINYNEGSRKTKNIDNNVGNVFQSVWLRHIIQNGIGFDRFILENRPHFLFHFNAILFILFILKFKK